MGIIEGVHLTPIKIIKHPNGDILHALKNFEDSYMGFGEAYFSTVNFNIVKGWKKHQEMILNIVVPVGVIKFVLFDGREQSTTRGKIEEIILSKDNYQRITVPPGVWMAFQGQGKDLNMLLNIASIPHNPSEAESLPLSNNIIPYVFN